MESIVQNNDLFVERCPPQEEPLINNYRDSKGIKLFLISRPVLVQLWLSKEANVS